MQTPNIFDYATSELSQDAFLCWLLSWANADHARTDHNALHETGIAFIRDIMRKCGQSPSKEQLRIGSVYKQYEGIDVLAGFSQGSTEYVLVIEDKTDTTMHGDQLKRYKKIITEKYPVHTHTPLLVYLKTGAISCAREAEAAGYTVYSGRDFLTVLAKRKSRIGNNIFTDFYNYLEAKVTGHEAFRHEKVDQWTTSEKAWEAWEGFFSKLQSKITKLEWSYQPNQSGGELVAYWLDMEYQGCKAYLEFHVKPEPHVEPDERAFLAFKIGEVPKEKQSQMRNAFHKKVMESAQKHGWGESVVKPPRFGTGNSMVCCQTKKLDCWLAKDAEGELDMNKTLDHLKIAEKILGDACAEVEVSREGDAVILRPHSEHKRDWNSLRSALKRGISDDFMEAGRAQPTEQDRPIMDALFD